VICLKVFKKVGVKSFAKFNLYYMGIMGLFFGLVAGIPMLLFGPSSGEFGSGFGRVMGLAFLIGAPLFYGVMGLVFGYLGGLIFNFILKISGGIEFEMEEGTITAATVKGDKPANTLNA
jgi:hypothetical protein